MQVRISKSNNIWKETQKERIWSEKWAHGEDLYSYPSDNNTFTNQILELSHKSESSIISQKINKISKSVHRQNNIK